MSILGSTNVEPPFRPASAWIAKFRETVEAGTVSGLITTFPALNRFELGHGLLTVIGAPPGRGKTALACQIMFEAIANNHNLGPVYFTGNDTAFSTIVMREVTRRTNINYDAIRFNNLTSEQQPQVLTALTEIEHATTSLRVLDPATWSSLRQLPRNEPAMLIVDYIQSHAPPELEIRQGVGHVMKMLRDFANNGWAVLALSAVKRPSTGSYDDAKLDLSSFRESSDIDFAVDAAYVLKNTKAIPNDSPARNVRLECVKNRNGAQLNIDLSFDPSAMQFGQPIPEHSNNPFQP